MLRQLPKLLNNSPLRILVVSAERATILSFLQDEKEAHPRGNPGYRQLETRSAKSANDGIASHHYDSTGGSVCLAPRSKAQRGTG